MPRPRVPTRLAVAIGVVALAIIASGLGMALSGGGPSGRPLVYSDLVAAMRARTIASAEITPDAGRVKVKLRSGRTEEVSFPRTADHLADRLAAAGARVTVARGHAKLPGPIVFILVVFMVLGAVIAVRAVSQKKGGGRFGAGHDMDLRRSAKVEDDDRPVIGFGDVAGCDEAVEEVREFVEFLRDPDRFTSVGARMPSGVILHGPPGTGKTLLAKALAGEAGVAFFAVSGSEFVEQFVGVGAKRVRELFARARAAKDGAVIFIDELDAIGKRRSGHGTAGDGERDGTLNELLVQLDGFGSDRRVIAVAATNRLDTLDEALLRPGRFARQVAVDLPTEEGRREIIGLHARGKPLAAAVDLERLASITSGSSGADLADMLNEAAIMAARGGRLEISQADLEEGHLRALAGPEKRSNGLREDEKATVAAHEAGHALCAEVCETMDKAQRATIRPRGRAAGLAVYGRSDRALHDAASIHEQLVCLLGGRAAEWVTFGKVSSGAANDLQQANAIARRAIGELGLSARAGQIVVADGLADTTRAGIDAETERLVTEAYREAIALLGEHRAELDRVAAALLAAGDIDRAEILAAIGRPLEPRPTRPGFGELAA